MKKRFTTKSNELIFQQLPGLTDPVRASSAINSRTGKGCLTQRHTSSAAVCHFAQHYAAAGIILTAAAWTDTPTQLSFIHPSIY